MRESALGKPRNLFAYAKPQPADLAAGALDEAGYAAWLKTNSRRPRRAGR